MAEPTDDTGTETRDVLVPSINLDTTDPHSDVYADVTLAAHSEVYANEGQDPTAVNDGNGFGVSDDETDSEAEQIVLDPEHPLMIRFQNALGSHLKKRLEQLELQERDLNIKMADSKKERENLGVVLYSEQQQLALYQARLDSLNQTLVAHSAQRLHKEAEMEALRKLYKNTASQSDEARAQASKLHTELGNLNMRLFCLMASHDDVRSDVKVMKRAALKTRQDLTTQEVEKQKQDYRADFLVELIDEKRTEVDMYKAQLYAQQAETKRYRELLTDACMELEVINADVKQVHSNWKSTLLGMSIHDETLASTLKYVTNEEQVLLSKDKEIEAYKRSIHQSEVKHEKLTYILNRVENDIATSKKSLTRSQKKHEDLKVTFTQKSRVMQTLEKLISKVHADKSSRESELASLRKQLEKVMEERNELKEELFDRLQSHSVNRKAAEYSKKKTRAILHHINRLENEMSIEENALAVIEQNQIELESKVANSKEQLASAHQETKERNEIVSNYESSFDKNHNVIERKQNYMDECNRKLARLLEARDGNEVSPLENLVLNLSRSLRKESNNMLDDQTMWVEKQQELLNLVQDKLDVEVEIKRKQQDVVIMNRRKRKVDNAIEAQNHAIKLYTVDMRHLRIEMEKLALQVNNHSGKKEEIEASSILLETDFIRELKEMEVSMLERQEKLESLNNEKEALLNNLVQIERQTAWWERKIQLGIEIKAAVDPKNNENTDLFGMKAELHRMTMRYQSLMKEQQRLIRSMEDCVTRREYTVTGYKAMVNRESEFVTKSKCKRKIHEAKEKIKQFKKEMVEIDAEKDNLQKTMRSLGMELNDRKSQVSEIRMEIDDMEAGVTNAANEKYKNLSELVRRQKKSSYYSGIKSGKYKSACSKPSELEGELEKETGRMNRLINIVARLKQEFPAATLMLDRVICSYGFTFTAMEAGG